MVAWGPEICFFHVVPCTFRSFLTCCSSRIFRGGRLGHGRAAVADDDGDYDDDDSRDFVFADCEVVCHFHIHGPGDNNDIFRQLQS